MTTLVYRGERYNDDRLYVLHLTRCTSRTNADRTVSTTIYHDSPPASATWCLVTYRNTPRYLAVRVDPFDSLEAARAYLERVEPTVPLISLGGRSPTVPLPYPQYVAWKTERGFRDYDYRTMYAPGGTDAQEIVVFPERP